MAKGVRVEVEGLERLIKKFNTIPDHVVTEVDADMRTVAESYVGKAVSSLNSGKITDTGFMKSQITYKKVKDMEYDVVSGARYSAFVEFGTRGKTKIPQGLEDYAAQFKGMKWGDYYDFLNAILDWVKRKGIGGNYRGSVEKLSGRKKDRLLAVAEAIAWSIIKKGSEAHPFFFIHLKAAQQQVKQLSKQAVAKALSKP